MKECSARLQTGLEPTPRTLRLQRTRTRSGIRESSACHRKVRLRVTESRGRSDRDAVRSDRDSYVIERMVVVSMIVMLYGTESGVDDKERTGHCDESPSVQSTYNHEEKR